MKTIPKDGLYTYFYMMDSKTGNYKDAIMQTSRTLLISTRF